MSDALVCLCTCPDPDAARGLARRLVEAGHAACVNVLPGISSVYRWQGALHEDTEALLVIKTTVAAYPALESLLRAHHPYELPELIAVPVEKGLPQYLAWLTDSTC